MTQYEAVIGLETHIQLNTASKIFCSCKADSWDDAPNTNICPVCTGLPGVLPVLNQAAVDKAALLAAAMGADLQPVSYFDRKNYFYPDLPKGYQISQYDQPLARGGHLDLPTGSGRMRRVSIHKLHLDEAAQYLIRLRQLLRWLGVSEADMERGHLRADANVSIREVGSDALNTKTEIKNVNSIDSLRTAITAEIERQIRVVERGEKVEPWTLGWDESSGSLRKMRSKETEADYRYFREPDLLPIYLNDEW